MKILAASLFAIGISLAAVSVSQAMPVASLDEAASSDASIVPVAGGCGPGWHRGALWRLPPDVQLPSRLAFGAVRPPLLPQLVR
jgi:hypothetical protein